MSTKTDIRWPCVEPAPDPYYFRGAALPGNLRESLDRYARYGVPTGGFLRSILEDEPIFKVLPRADDDSLKALPAIAGYIYNCLPGNCWGSPEAVQGHIEKWFPLSSETEGESDNDS